MSDLPPRLKELVRRLVEALRKAARERNEDDPPKDDQ